MDYSYLIAVSAADRKASDYYEDVVKSIWNLKLYKHASMIIHLEKKRVEMAHELASELMKKPNIRKCVTMGNTSDNSEKLKVMKREIFKMALIAVSEVGLSNKKEKIVFLLNKKAEKYWEQLFCLNTPIAENYTVFHDVFTSMINRSHLPKL